MDEDTMKGGAGPALAAHSKDGSAAGQTAASQATGHTQPSSKGSQEDSVLDQAREAVGRAASTLTDVAGRGGERISQQTSVATDQLTKFAREQPVLALAVTGLVGFMLGVLVGRR